MYTTRTEPIIQRNADRARRRAAGIDGIDDDEPIPDSPTVPDTFRPFTDEQQEKIDEFTEAFHHYTRALQHTLTKVTKGEPYRFVVQCNYNNSSGFETWRRLHMTYDQEEKAQQLGTLSRIMRPTWSNLQQPPGEFIKNFQNWRDEIFNYENSNLATANFDDAATQVEDYYRNVYIDNNNPGGIQSFKDRNSGKPWKGKDKKGKGDYNYKGKGSENQPSQQPQQPYQPCKPWKGKGKGG
eukprot:5200790-Amphidinium_carterae.1